MTVTPEEIEQQIALLDRAIEDIQFEKTKARRKLWELRNPPPSDQMLRLAGRHISDVVMYEGHSVTESDILALRRVIDYMAAHLNTPDEEHT